MRIKVEEKNKEKIAAAIAAAEGKATARTLKYDDIAKTIEKVEAKLNITKKTMDGTKVNYSPNEKMPNAYKYTTDGTKFEAEYSKGNWYLVSISRGTISKHTYKSVYLRLSETAKAAIIENHVEF